MVRGMTQTKQQNPETPANFAETENKSLANQQEETKAADESPNAPDAVRVDGAVIPVESDGETEVEFLFHVDYDGEDYLPGDKLTLPKAVAQSFVASKRAKLA